MSILNDSKTASSPEKIVKEKFGSKTTASQVLQNVDLTGKTFLITGTTAGIGVETARCLALRGAHIVMANRNIELSEKLRENIYKETDKRNIDIIKLDLSSLKSVKEAADEFLSHNWPLHVLILNAGVYNPPNKTTADGYETTFGVNHLGHFYLTQLLSEKLRQSAPSRVVIVSSALHRKTGISSSKTVEDQLIKLIPQANTNESAFKLYNYSKLCNILMAEKSHRNEIENQVSVFSLHPGIIFGTHILNSRAKLQAFLRFVAKPFTKTVEQGAATTVYCATMTDLESGKYFDNCSDDEKDLYKSLARNHALQDALWEKSLEIIKKFEENDLNNQAKQPQQESVEQEQHQQQQPSAEQEQPAEQQQQEQILEAN